MRRFGLYHLLTVLICTIAAAAAFSSRTEPVSVAGAAAFDPARILIIDAGHGGEDGGAISASGRKESEINLSIALKMENVAALYGLHPVMTRDSELIAYPEDALTTRARKRADQQARAALINEYPEGILVSVHQNLYPAPGPHGAQVMYAATEGSAQLAQVLQEQLTTLLDPSNTRSASKISDSIFLLRNIDCTAVLLECGFISNPAEEALLTSDAYQIKLASIVAGSVILYLSFNGSDTQ